ncbi:MAG: hypothetical protein QM723_20075 [Myxococcaceae bacterium]
MAKRGWVFASSVLVFCACFHRHPTPKPEVFSCQSSHRSEAKAGDQAVISTLFHTVPPGESAAQLASAYCQLFAGPRGEAAVVGEQILVKDDHDGHDKLDALIRAVAQGRDGGTGI